MFLFVSEADICKFADDNTTSSFWKVLSDTLRNLKFDSGRVLKQFKVNSLKPNPGKFQFMILRANTGNKLKLCLDGNKIEKCQEVVLLRISIDEALKRILKIFVKHTNTNLHALQRVRKHLNLDKARCFATLL